MSSYNIFDVTCGKRVSHARREVERIDLRSSRNFGPANEAARSRSTPPTTTSVTAVTNFSPPTRRLSKQICLPLSYLARSPAQSPPLAASHDAADRSIYASELRVNSNLLSGASLLVQKVSNGVPLKHRAPQLTTYSMGEALYRRPRMGRTI